MSFYDYEESPKVTYDGAVFVRACPECGRFVKADQEIYFHVDGPPKTAPNATCKKHGRVEMPFEGFYP